MRTIQRIDEKQKPEAQHREKMAPNRAARGCRNHPIGHHQRQWRNEQAYRVMDPQPTKCSPHRPRNKLRDKIANWVGQQRENKSADQVPTRDINIRKTQLEKRDHKLENTQGEGQDDKEIDDEWEFRPFQGLAMSQQN